jgi:predicted PurR-regulated permease PerM
MKSTSREERRPGGWRSRDVLRVLALVAGFYIALQLLWAGRSVILLTFLGVLLGLVLGSGVDRLERRKVPRTLGTTLLVLAFFGLLGGLGALTAPSIAGQLGALRTRLPDAVGQIEEWVQTRERGISRFLTQVAPPDTAAAQERGRGRPATRALEPAQDTSAAKSGEQAGVSLRRGIAQQIAGLWQNFFAVFSSTLAVLGGLVLILFVAIFVAVDTRMYHRGLMHLFPHRMRAEAGEVLSATATMLRRWLVAQLVSMLAIGVLTTVVLLLLGVEAALALGIIAGLLEFIPFVGPILSAVPAVGMAFLDGPMMAIYVVIAYILIQQVEANLLYPLLMKKGLEIPPVLTIVTQGVMSLVFGFVGLLVAVPMLAASIVPIKMLYVRDVVGDPVKLPGDAQTGHA